MRPYELSDELERCVLVLSIDDIIGQANSRGIELSDEQLKNIYYEFDADEIIMEAFYNTIDKLLDKVQDYNDE